VGSSFEDRGMRKDQHDVVAFALRVRGASQPTDMDASSTAGSEDSKREPKSEPAESDAEKSDAMESDADAAHDKMRQMWEERYNVEYEPKIISQLGRVLFLKRKPLDNSAGASQPGEKHELDEDSTAFATQEETRQAILSVLKLRQRFLQDNAIYNMCHILSSYERGELAKSARMAYEMSAEQLDLQRRDEEKASAKGKPLAAKGKGKARSKVHADGDAQPTSKGGVAKFIRQQKRKRWCRHLQRICGTKQIWEVLAYTGCFDVDYLRKAIQAPGAEEEPEISASASEQKQQRRALHHAKAEAKKAYKEGERLARNRNLKRLHDSFQPAGSYQEAATLSKNQLDVLKQWDRGWLLDNLNQAIGELGHGRLQSQTGDFLEIGGSTGGGSRRVIDGWVPPDWRKFLNEGEFHS
jgi:hypothetical protein